MAHQCILCNCSIAHIPEARQILEFVGEVTYAEHKYLRLLEVIGDYEALLPSLDVCLDKILLQRAKRLKLIPTPSTGTDQIDLKSAAKCGIEVMSLKNDTDFLKKVTATAELSFGLILSITRQIPFAFDSVKPIAAYGRNQMKIATELTENQGTEIEKRNGGFRKFGYPKCCTTRTCCTTFGLLKFFHSLLSPESKKTSAALLGNSSLWALWLKNLVKITRI